MKTKIEHLETRLDKSGKYFISVFKYTHIPHWIKRILFGHQIKEEIKEYAMHGGEYKLLPSFTNATEKEIKKINTVRNTKKKMRL